MLGASGSQLGVLRLGALEAAVLVAFSRGVIVATLVSGDPELLMTSQNAVLIMVDENGWLSAEFSG